MEHKCIIGTLTGLPVHDINDPMITQYAMAVAEFNLGGRSGPKHPGNALIQDPCTVCGTKNALQRELREKLVLAINDADLAAAADKDSVKGAASAWSKLVAHA